MLPTENRERTGFRTKREVNTVNWIASGFLGLHSNMFCVFQLITALAQFRNLANAMPRVYRWVLWQYKVLNIEHGVEVIRSNYILEGRN